MYTYSCIPAIQQQVCLGVELGLPCSFLIKITSLLFKVTITSVLFKVKITSLLFKVTTFHKWVIIVADMTTPQSYVVSNFLSICVEIIYLVFFSLFFVCLGFFIIVLQSNFSNRHFVLYVSKVSRLFFVLALLLIVHTWNSSLLRSNLLMQQSTCCTVPTTSGRPHGSPLVWACQWPSSQPLSSPQLSLSLGNKQKS